MTRRTDLLVLLLAGAGMFFPNVQHAVAAQTQESATAEALSAQEAANPRSSPAPEEPTGELSLERARALALAFNPELLSLSRAFEAGEAAVLQARALPNPALAATTENLGNQRLKEGGDQATVVQLGQLIELGGKRAARVRFAKTGRDLAARDYQVKRADVLLQVSVAFVDVLAGQQRQTLAEESVALARTFVDVVSKRVSAGKSSPVEETRARLSLYAVEVELEQTRRELTAARQRLSALWNNPAPKFQTAVGELEQLPALPGAEHLRARARLANPDLARAESEIAQREAAVEAARAKAVPDLTLIGGIARFSQFNDTAYTLGVSIPLPVFDRNRGGVLEAARLRDQAIDQRRVAQLRVDTELAEAEQRLAAIRSEIEALRSGILPGAQSAFDATRKGYELGKFAFIDVIDAQRTLFQVRSQYLSALSNYQRGIGQIERLVGDSVAEQPVGAGAESGDTK